MLVIRGKQLDQLAQSDADAFEEKIMAHVLKECPSRLPDYMIKRMVRTGIARARSFGFTGNAQILGFVTIMFSFCPNFCDQPQFKRVFSDTQIPPTERWNEIFTEKYDGVWEQVSKPEFYDEKAWTPAETADAFAE